MSVEGAQQFTIEVAATPSDCFATIVDFAAYPSWSSAVRQARVLEHDRNGIGRLVEFSIDMRIRNVRYVLEYAYKKPSLLTWQSVDGDVEKIEGAYRFLKLGAGRTETTCEQAVRLGFWVPGPIRSLAERTALRQSVTEFKEEVERRIADKGAGRRDAKSRRA
jgi:ribosome-associated toxin RatA of RatAB toxin-antitoxin module